MLERFDMFDYFVTPLAPDFKKRSLQLEEFKNIRIYILSKEDIIVSKLSRFSEKDQQDIKVLLQTANKTFIIDIINRVIERNDFSERVKEVFIKNVESFKENFYV